MRVAYHDPTTGQRQPLSRRAVVLLFVLLVHAFLVGLLLLLTPQAPPGKPEARSFTLLPDQVIAPKPTPKPAIKTTLKGATKRTPVQPKPIAPPEKLFGTEMFEAVDITKLPNHREELAQGTGQADSGVGADSQTVTGPGGGPHGEPLYKAEWQREPTHAELAFYLPKSGVPAGSWATIACRTAERFRVEDCEILGESPPGSRLASSLREASWQFRVRPPRLGGKTLVGAWVSIRFEFTEKGER